MALLDDRSSLVESILVSAQQTKRGSFRVIIVDSRPGVEGRQLADILSAEGIPCTYVLLTAISYMMRVSTIAPELVSDSYQGVVELNVTTGRRHSFMDDLNRDVAAIPYLSWRLWSEGQRNAVE